MKYLFIVSLLIMVSCNSKSNCERIEFTATQLDSVKQKMDTSFNKIYRSEEFATTEYYINKKDSSVCQLMKDKSGIIRQVIMTKNEIRFFSAEYFSNGQAKSNIGFDHDGSFDGPGIYYYETGCIKSSGSFRHGLYSGEWKNYNANGKLVSTDIYNGNGQIIKTVVPE